MTYINFFCQSDLKFGFLTRLNLFGGKKKFTTGAANIQFKAILDHPKVRVKNKIIANHIFLFFK